MESTITLGSALEVLRKRYEKEYERFDDVLVSFDLKSRMHTYTDWGGFTESEIYYLFYAKITYFKKIKDLILSNSVVKDIDELENDLIDELKKIYDDEEFVVSNVSFPEYDNNNYELDDDVNIDFEEIKTKKLVKKEEL